MLSWQGSYLTVLAYCTVDGVSSFWTLGGAGRRHNLDTEIAGLDSERRCLGRRS